jgi:hypothetical protein
MLQPLIERLPSLQNIIVKRWHYLQYVLEVDLLETSTQH